MIPTLTFVFLFMAIKFPRRKFKMPKLGVISGLHPSVPPALCGVKQHRLGLNTVHLGHEKGEGARQGFEALILGLNPFR